MAGKWKRGVAHSRAIKARLHALQVVPKIVSPEQRTQTDAAGHAVLNLETPWRDGSAWLRLRHDRLRQFLP